MTVTPDAVEAAARAMHETHNGPRAVSWDKAGHHVRQAYMDNARAALAAAAPLIAKQTLESAAEEVRLTCPPCGPDGPTDEIHQAVIDTVTGVHALITARAATLTPKDTP